MRKIDLRLLGWLLALPVSVMGLFISGSGLSMLLNLQGKAYTAVTGGFVLFGYLAIAVGMATLFRARTPVETTLPPDEPRP